MTKFDPIQKYEPLSREQWEKIMRVFSPMAAIVAGLNYVDHRYGAGVIDANTKCVWTRQRRRVVLSSKDGTTWASLSKKEDPACPRRNLQQGIDILRKDLRPDDD